MHSCDWETARMFRQPLYALFTESAWYLTYWHWLISSFLKGDMFIVHNELDDGWMWVTNVRTEEQGLIVEDLVEEVVSAQYNMWGLLRNKWMVIIMKVVFSGLSDLRCDWFLDILGAGGGSTWGENVSCFSWFHVRIGTFPVSSLPLDDKFWCYNLVLQHGS